jgi:hypothetical protein
MLRGVLALMPRYHFHIADGRPYRDEDGSELPSDDVAWREAKRMARDIEDALQPGERWQLEVRDGRDLIFGLAINSIRYR